MLYAHLSTHTHIALLNSNYTSHLMLSARSKSSILSAYTFTLILFLFLSYQLSRVFRSSSQVVQFFLLMWLGGGSSGLMPGWSFLSCMLCIDILQKYNASRISSFIVVCIIYTMSLVHLGNIRWDYCWHKRLTPPNLYPS